MRLPDAAFHVLGAKNRYGGQLKYLLIITVVLETVYMTTQSRGFLNDMRWGLITSLMLCTHSLSLSFSLSPSHSLALSVARAPVPRHGPWGGFCNQRV
jgi:hypothetical protein